MKGGGQQKEKVDEFKECERKELARQALAAEAALQAQEAEEAAREAARLAEEAEAALKAKEAFQKRLDEDARYAAEKLSEWHKNYKKSSCNILGGRGRIKNTFRKKNKSKRGNKRFKKNKRYSRKSSSKSLKK